MVIATGSQSSSTGADRPPVRVVSLGARGYLDEDPAGGTACSVLEFAVLDDGREVTLTDDRGWSTSTPWETISLTHALRNIYNVVLPDDAEVTAETHEWRLFTQRLRESGVIASIEALRSLPYHVVLSVRGSG